MFPLKADDPYINKDGSRTTLGDIIGDISDIQDAVDDVADSITPVSQTGTKATTAITAGTQFYLNGNLVKAKTNIAIGDTFTSGTNYDDADDIATQIDNLKSSLNNCWIMEEHDQTIILATADGIKTVQNLLDEATTSLRAISIPSGYAYQLTYILIPYADASGAQTSVEVSRSTDLWTSFGSAIIRGSRSVPSSANSITTYTLQLADPAYFTSYGVGLSTGTVTPKNDYYNNKPSSGTTLHIKYNKWKKV